MDETLKLNDINENAEANIENIVDEEKPVPVDCIIDVRVDEKYETVEIRARAPLNGGNEVSKELIMQALAEKNVVFGINDSMIDTIVNDKLYGKWFCVAKCQEPQDGEDGRVEYLFEQSVTGVPREDEHGNVNFRDLGTVRNITEGTVIANIFKETPGVPGTNVLGQTMNPVPGKPPEIRCGENIAYDEEKLQLIATADGNLVFKNGRFEVETVVRINGDVDVSTGNIDFIGEVVVRGDVKEGFKVTSGKSILVQGGAFGATLEAVQKITVKKGAIGSRIVSGGSVEIDFGENSNINCHETLRARSLFFCDVFCKGEVYVTTNIIGGRVISTKNLTASSIGSKSYTPTQIIIGDNAIMLQERTSLANKIEEFNVEEEKCTKIVEFLTQKKIQLGGLPPDKVEIITEAAKSILLFRREKEQLSKRIEEIDEYLQTKQNLSVTCKKELYPGVKITINDYVLTINTTYQYCVVGVGEDGIEVRNL